MSVERPPSVRTCRKCGATRPLAEFQKARRCHFGRSHTCKICLRDKVREWREENPEVTAERLQALISREQTPELRAKKLAADKKRLAEVAECETARHITVGARRRGAEIVETVIPLVVLELHDGVCGICGEDVDPFDFQLDHIVACSDGGEHSYENVQLAHQACNGRKEIERRGPEAQRRTAQAPRPRARGPRKKAAA